MFVLLRDASSYTVMDVRSTTVQDEVPGTEEQYLTINEIRANLRVSRNTVNKWIRSGRLEVIKLDDSQQGGVRVTVESYDRFLQEQTVQAKAAG